MIKIIFFDIGGTLCESDDIFENLADALGKPKDKKTIEFLKNEFMGLYKSRTPENFMTVVAMLQSTLKKASEEFGLKDISQKAESIYIKTYVDGARLNRDTLDILEFAKRKGIKMIVASDADSHVLIAGLRMLKISHYFDSMVISSNVKGYKPSLPMTMELHKHCTVPLQNILFVGDSDCDVETAKQLGIKSAYYNPEGKLNKSADYNISSLNVLRKIL